MNSEDFVAIIAQKCSVFFKEMQGLCEAFTQQAPQKKKVVNRTGVPKNSDIKDPEMPKKPPTAYILYFKNRKEYFIEKYPQQGITTITKLIAKEWGELTKDKQIPFLREAEKAKLEYFAKMKTYAVNHPEIKVPGEGRRRRNRIRNPLYQDSPTKKEGEEEEGEEDEEGVSEEEVNEEEFEESIESSLHISSSVAVVKKDELKVDEKLPEIVPIKSTAVSSSSTAPLNAKRKVTVLSDDDESGSYSNDKDEDSFEDMPLKKKKII